LAISRPSFRVYLTVCRMQRSK